MAMPELVPKLHLYQYLIYPLGPQPVSNLDPTYHTPPKTKHTCELAALVQVQAGEVHALEHLDVAWGNGVDGE